MQTPGPWPRPGDDAARVAALRDLAVLDRPSDPDLEAVARVAAHIAGTPTAAINLIDEDRQWQAAAHGLEPGEVSRDDSMCGWSILSDDVTYVPDAAHDEVFTANPFVTGRLGSVRLYVSAPVIIDTGHVVGTVCAFGTRPGRLEPEQFARLRDLATTAARILELRRTLAKVARAATRDPLTGLPNRTIFEDAVRRAVAHYARGVSRPGVLYLDLNDFKPVNDLYGHHAGDAVLCAVADRLVANLRATDVVARLGGDEFAILIEERAETALAERLRRLAARLARTLPAPVLLEDGTAVSVGVSIGVAAPERGEDSPEALIARADAAMYVDKGRGRSALAQGDLR